jgi:SAM-dependent methyltransferase
MTIANLYSRHWFEFFHLPISAERTAREVEFICAVAPLPEFRNLLDLCCGMGRHARALAACGYRVTAVERDQVAIAEARAIGGRPTYVQADVRDYEPEQSAYDLAIIMSQSFGYFDPATNRSVLTRIADGLRTGGRVVLDLWNPEFFAAHQGERDLETPAGVVRETKKVSDGRLFVHLGYPDGVEEDFDWQLFTMTEMRSLADSTGLVVVNECTDFDPARKPNRTNPRIQFVLEKA